MKDKRLKGPFTILQRFLSFDLEQIFKTPMSYAQKVIRNIQAEYRRKFPHRLKIAFDTGIGTFKNYLS